MSSVSLVATRAWDLVDDVAPLQGWDGVFNVSQVGSRGGVGLVGNLDIVGVESSSYGLRDALYEGQHPPNGGWCVLRFV